MDDINVIKAAFHEEFSAEYLEFLDTKSTTDMSLVELLWMSFARGYNANPPQRQGMVIVSEHELEELEKSRIQLCKILPSDNPEDLMHLMNITEPMWNLTIRIAPKGEKQ